MEIWLSLYSAYNPHTCSPFIDDEHYFSLAAIFAEGIQKNTIHFSQESGINDAPMTKGIPARCLMGKSYIK
jgi:hypothetical protein